MAEEVVVKKIIIDSTQATKSLDDLGKSTDSVKASTGELGKSTAALPGPLGKAQSGIQALNRGFKALLANPIVLLIAGIVAALAGLFKAFTKTQEGADKMKNAMAALHATLDVVVGRLAQIFKALTKIVTGKFKEGFEDMKDAVSGVGEEIRGATKDAIEFEKATRRLFDTETELATVNAQRRQQIAELVFATRDLTKSVEERRQAIIDADAIEKEILADNIFLQQQRLDLARQEILNTPENLRTREQLRKAAEAEATLIDLQTESLRRQKKLKQELNTLDNEAAAARKAALTEQAEKEKVAEEERLAREKAASDQRKEDKELELLLEEEFQAGLLELDKGFAEMRAEVAKENTEEIKKQSEKRFSAEEKLIQKQIANEMLLQQAKESIYQDGVTALLGFLKEGSALAKGVQVADATRTAIVSAMQAYKATIGIPIAGPVLAPIAAGAALAVGLANVRKLIQVEDPTGAASPPSPSVNLARPQTSINTQELTGVSQGIPSEVSIIQDATTRGAQKVYVVQSDVTAEQDIAKQRIDDVTI